jgi:RNA polymerase sigma-70 factor, ECF subfamily
VSDPSPTPTAPARELVALYDRSVGDVYGYLVRRCGSEAIAEDLTSETFMAAVDALHRDPPPELTVAWLVGVARHKLVDHWRRTEREQRKLALVGADAGEDLEDPWDARLDAAVAHEVLGRLGPHHRSVLVLRYLDGLTVPEIARCIDRTVGATEVLLVRARRAFRASYSDEPADPATRQGGEP